MGDIVKSLYNAGYSLWDTIVGIAMTLFTTSPTAAGGGVYGTAYALFLAISDISIPIAIVFFMIAIIKDVTSTPPDQQIRRFFMTQSSLELWWEFWLICGALWGM